MELPRRDFLGLAAGGLAAAVHAGAAAAALDERRKVRVAVMGLNGRGKQLLPDFMAFPEVEIAYLCDPDEATLAPAARLVTEKGKEQPRLVRDFRRALDDDGVDVLICAAPDHWHALATIWACQAGKDVYVEKPVSHNVREGQAMVRAARKYERVVQVGTQRRSSAEFAAAARLIQSGALGKIHMVRTWINSVRPSIGKEPVASPPANLDFDLWAGPGRGDDYKRNLVHYHWHWRWEYGTGECGNNGIHALDVARGTLGVAVPHRVTCAGDKYYFDDDQETPDTQLATFEYPGLCIHWEHRTWTKRGIDGQDFGVTFYGTDGTLVYRSKGWEFLRGDKVVEKHEGSERDRAHIRNFLDCRMNRTRPAADIEEGHLSTQLCHLANIAWRTRSVVEVDPSTAEIQHNPAAAALLGREYRKGYELPAV